MEYFLQRKLQKGELLKLYWLRLTLDQAKKLLADNGRRLIDPDLQKKYGIKTCTRGSTVYIYNEVIDENGEVTKTNIREFCDVLAVSTMASTKGVAFYDANFAKQPGAEYALIMDEYAREKSEKNSFDLVYCFSNLIQNLVRHEDGNIRIILCGNLLEDCSDLLAATGFLPPGPGRYKLRSKKTLIEVIERSESNKKTTGRSLSYIFTPDASTFTNKIEIDASLLVNKRKCKAPQYIIKFTKSQDTWYTVWNDGIIKPYNGEKKPIIAMRRYIDEFYTDERRNIVMDQFNSRGYLFTSIATFKRFQKELMLLKK